MFNIAAGRFFLIFILHFGTCSLEASLERPPWYPQNYDMKEASRGVAEILHIQGKDLDLDRSRRVDSIIFSDADQTLMKTRIPILLKDKATGQLVKDPATGKILRLPNRSYLTRIAKLKKEYPNIAWDSFEIDFQEMGSIVAIEDTPPIKHIVEILKNADLQRGNREFIITARSSDVVPQAFEEYFSKLGIVLDGVFAVNNPSLNERLKFKGLGLSAAQKKAVTMAAIIELYLPPGGLKEVSFYDDGDDNLQMAMLLLPAMFPQITFRFYDVVYVGNNQFCLKPVAISRDRGRLFSADGGREMTVEEINSYFSRDALLPDEG